jgi:chromosome segregation ATPase
VSALSSKCASLQVTVDRLRDDHNKLLGRLADVTSKWQATVVENAALNAKNGELQQSLLAAQQAVAAMQREREELRCALQQQQQAALCQQQQQQVALSYMQTAACGREPHAAAYSSWQQC